ncbi:MAG TPA: polymer-forming cytoskeletal protein [Rhizomicrobium sp.]|jgi:cytoskeletal protein CcmA (bactofilin family)
MFSNKNREAADVVVPAPPQPPAGAKRPVRSSAPSIISADLTVNGTLTSEGDVQIDGRVEGDVHSAGLVIGEKAFIRGEIMAEDVTVRGRVDGSIRARKVLLCANCHVEGNILHEALAMEAGAFFEGNCRHSENPLGDDAGRPRSIEPKPAAAVQPMRPNDPATTTVRSGG